MEIIVTNNMGNTSYTFKIEEKDDKSALNKAITLGNTPSYCHECKNTQGFALDTNKDKEGNVYISVKCLKCGAKSGLGTYKTGGFFWKKFEKYVPQGTSEPKKAGGTDWED